MDYDAVTKFTIVLSVVAVIFAAAAVIMVATDDDGGDDRYVLYIGMDSGASQDLMDDVESHMKDYITSNLRTGYTMYWADGAYVDGSGNVVENDTLVIVLLDVSSGTADRIADEAMAQNGVSSVAKETYSSGFTLG